MPTFFTLFAVFIAVIAIRKTALTWGGPAAAGLAAGLGAVGAFLPLGAVLALGAAVGALVFAEREDRRRITAQGW